MPYDFLNNNPLLADMSPEKLQFLMNFATAKKPTDIKEMMPFLLSAMIPQNQITSSSVTGERISYSRS